MSNRITQWMPAAGTIDTVAGHLTNLQWLQRERERFASKGKIAHIQTIEPKAGCAGGTSAMRLVALFAGAEQQPEPVAQVA